MENKRSFSIKLSAVILFVIAAIANLLTVFEANKTFLERAKKVAADYSADVSGYKADYNIVFIISVVIAAIVLGLTIFALVRIIMKKDKELTNKIVIGSFIATTISGVLKYVSSHIYILTKNSATSYVDKLETLNYVNFVVLSLYFAFAVAMLVLLILKKDIATKMLIPFFIVTASATLFDGVVIAIEGISGGAATIICLNLVVVLIGALLYWTSLLLEDEANKKIA